MSNKVIHFSFLIIATLFTIVTPTSAEEKITHLHIYFHEFFSGQNATLVTPVTLNRNTTFGDINLFDNTLRVGPQPDSELIGRAQGMNVHAALDGSTVLSAINLIFTCGEYNGSSLAILGPLHRTGPTERSIVGGTWKFRFARGYMLSHIVNITDTSIVAEFDLYFKLF